MSVLRQINGLYSTLLLLVDTKQLHKCKKIKIQKKFVDTCSFEKLFKKNFSEKL